MCEESGALDTKSNPNIMTMLPERAESMEYLEQLCKRLDMVEPGAQDFGPNARNPKISSSWHRQLVEWMLNVR